MSAGARLDWIPVRGDSMWPTLLTGDEAETLRLTSAPAPGEVVVARIAGQLVIHRVRAVRDGWLELKGDNCQDADPPVPLAEVVGKIHRVRRAGRLLAPSEWDRGPTLLGRVRLKLRRRVGGLWRRLR